jgi:alpha-1,3-rhamnosyl/mannosyltransferase
VSGLPLSARRVPFDVFHAPAYTAPLWGVRPLVVTIHDVSYARHPEWYPYQRDPIRRAFYRASALRADRVLTDSAFSRQEIVAAYGIAAERIDVVPLGVGAQFTPAVWTRRDDFVLHVGDLHPRRNLPMLLDVVMALRRGDPRCASLRLVLAGVDRGVLDGLRRQAAALPASLEYVGRPSDTALVDLYRRAAVFAYPSRYEGFGLPVLEAMACGAPIIAGRTGAVPEVVGDAGVLIDPEDRAAWQEALQAVLSDPARRARLSGAAVTRACDFTWERTARATLACYQRAVAARR